MSLCFCLNVEHVTLDVKRIAFDVECLALDFEHVAFHVACVALNYSSLTRSPPTMIFVNNFWLKISYIMGRMRKTFLHTDEAMVNKYSATLHSERE